MSDKRGENSIPVDLFFFTTRERRADRIHPSDVEGPLSIYLRVKLTLSAHL